MTKNYSKYKTFFEVEPELEKKASALVNSLGNQYILEGATTIGDGRFRVWFRDLTNKDTNQFDCKIYPIDINEIDESVEKDEISIDLSDEKDNNVKDKDDSVVDVKHIEITEPQAISEFLNDEYFEFIK